MNKKAARLAAKAALAITKTDVATGEPVDATTPKDAIVIPTPNASLPARNIRNSVSGVGASSTFKGVGTMAEHGIPAGLRRNHFQDLLLAWNEESGAHLDDDALAEIMDREHPLGGVRIVDRPELVATIRKFYNLGAHGKQQQSKPDVQSMQYGKPKVKSAVAPVAADDASDDAAAPIAVNS